MIRLVCCHVEAYQAHGPAPSLQHWIDESIATGERPDPDTQWAMRCACLGPWGISASFYQDSRTLDCCSLFQYPPTTALTRASSQRGIVSLCITLLDIRYEAHIPETPHPCTVQKSTLSSLFFSVMCFTVAISVVSIGQEQLFICEIASKSNRSNPETWERTLEAVVTREGAGVAPCLTSDNVSDSPWSMSACASKTWRR